MTLAGVQRRPGTDGGETQAAKRRGEAVPVDEVWGVRLMGIASSLFAVPNLELDLDLVLDLVHSPLHRS